jgi:hypothetical protein
MVQVITTHADAKFLQRPVEVVRALFKGLGALCLGPIVLIALSQIVLLAPESARTPLSMVAWIGLLLVAVRWLRGRPRVTWKIEVTRTSGREVVAMVAPVIVLLRSHLLPWTATIYGDADNKNWAFYGWRLGRSIRSGQWSYWMPDVVWPYGANLLKGDGHLPLAAVSMINAAVPRAPIAFNVTLAVCLVMNGWAMLRLCARFTAVPSIRAISAAAAFIAPTVMIKYGAYFNLVFLAPVIVLFISAIDVMLERRRLSPLRHGLLLALCFITSGYFFVLGVMCVTLMFVAGRTRVSWKTALAAAAVAVTMVSPLVVLRALHDRAEQAAGARPLSFSMAYRSADPGSMLGAPIWARNSIGGTSWEVTTSLGILLVLGLALCVGLRHPACRPLLWTIGALWLFGLGPTLLLGAHPLVDQAWLPYELLRHLPGTTTLRAPARSSLLVVPLATAASAAGLNALWPQLGRPVRGTIVWAACLLSAAVIVTTHLSTTLSIAGPPLVSVWKSVEREATIVLPADCERATWLMPLMIQGAGPMVGCQAYSAALPFASGLATYRASRSWAALRCLPDHFVTVSLPEFRGQEPTAAAVQGLRTELGVRYIVIDREADCPDSERAAAIRLIVHQSAVLLADDGRLLLYRIDG